MHSKKKKEVIGISHAEPDRCHLREEGKDITPKGNPDIGWYKSMKSIRKQRDELALIK